MSIVHSYSGFSSFTISAFIQRAVQRTDQSVPIISVGAGTAEIERDLPPNVRQRIVLVDPVSEPSSEIPGPVYSTVSNYLKKNGKPESCVLLLIWPSPEDSTYDIEAVEQLDPDDIIVYYENPPGWNSGAAGGRLFHQFLGNPQARGYELLANEWHQYRTERSWGTKYLKLEWLVKTALLDENSRKHYQHGFYGFDNNTEPDCVVM